MNNIEEMIQEELSELEQLFANETPAVLKQIKETFLESVTEAFNQENTKMLDAVTEHLEDLASSQNELEATLLMVEQLEDKLMGEQ
ncbi:hypothetical protein [Pseudoalteromonas sp. Q18-MNA-CIBAN-0097]|uniref:hypothetical protein n=1 Tax=Pseudoalteromonas sp. Q18-MNA-CIBAN-0097 TaxID=3140440 RepID=UPI00333196F2